MPRPSESLDWKMWLDRWDAQQAVSIPDRELRFSTMFDAVEAAVGRRFRALDLGSGPGSLSARLLRRFPGARCVAVDYDPVTFRIGQGALGSFGGRLTWVDAKLGRPGWDAALPRGPYDAVLSTTALHWLKPPQLGRLYRDLYRRLRRGGVLVNGDHLPWGPGQRGLSDVAAKVRRLRSKDGRAGTDWSAWKQWWDDAARVPALESCFREREARQSQHPEHPDTSLDVHVRRLKSAGFRDVTAVWQDFENRILFARR